MRCSDTQERILAGKRADQGRLVAGLVNWLFEHSISEELFRLRLDDEPERVPGKVAKFDHHHDSVFWALGLAAGEFARLQAAWKKHGLPQDLFFSDQDVECVPYPGEGWKARLLRVPGARKCYSPS